MSDTWYTYWKVEQYDWVKQRPNSIVTSSVDTFVYKGKEKCQPFETEQIPNKWRSTDTYGPSDKFHSETVGKLAVNELFYSKE